jgi:hypothetical protein
MLFKTTKDILKNPWEDELFDPNWMDSNKIEYPPRIDWDHKRPMVLEDVDIWEVLYYESGNIGVYAAWLPYAEFYLLRPGTYREQGMGFETYYGPKARDVVIARCKELDIPLYERPFWVDPQDMWKYEGPQEPKKLIIP